MTLFFDFDGTIVEVSERHYRAHIAALGEHRRVLSKDAYWKLKRANLSEEQVLASAYPQVDRERYLRERRDFLEDASFLQYDTTITGAEAVLCALQERHTLILVTVRRKYDRLQSELERLHIRSRFAQILCLPPGKRPWETKAMLMHPFVDDGSWMIGDTEADILAGQLLNIKTCAVLSGIRSAERLRSLSPDAIISTIADVGAVLFPQEGLGPAVRREF